MCVHVCVRACVRVHVCMLACWSAKAYGCLTGAAVAEGCICCSEIRITITTGVVVILISLIHRLSVPQRYRHFGLCCTFWA